MFHGLSKHLEFRQKYSAAVVFSTLFSVFGYPDATLSLELDILLPISKKLDEFSVKQDVVKFLRRVQLKAFFHDKEEILTPPTKTFSRRF